MIKSPIFMHPKKTGMIFNSRKISIIISLNFLIINFFFAQDKKKWDVNNPELPYKIVEFITSEGTWMNVDVSPDGKLIAFDLLGDIYTIPFAGGKAKPIRTGLAYEVQPRFSPDGKSILFTSDAGGGDNIWVMNIDGKNARQVTKENFRLLNNAVWMPDGEYFVARKHFTSTRSLGAGELWMYHIAGGTGVQITAKKNDQQDLNEPSISSDGNFIYFSEEIYPGGYFQYNKDPNNTIFAVKRYNRKTSQVEYITGGIGGACRPQISHDGKTLAFVKRVRTKSVLYLHDLNTGEEWPIFDSLSKDQQEAWTIFGVYTGFSWTPNDSKIVIWANGKINCVDVSKSNTSEIIPFNCNVKQTICEGLRFEQNLNPTTQQANIIRSLRTDPSGTWVVFSALGQLYGKQLPSGKPERLTQDDLFEFEPSFNTQGNKIVYVTWSDTASGSIRILDLTTKKTTILTAEKGIYREPSFSSDGKSIVYKTELGNDILGPGYTHKPGIYRMNLADQVPIFVHEKGDSPVFDSSGQRIFYSTGGQLFGSLNKTFGSFDLNGFDDKTHIKSTYASQYKLSPNGKYVAFVDLHKAYIATLPPSGKTIDLGAGTENFPVKCISKDAGTNLHWSSDSKAVFYTNGPEYFKVDLADRFDFSGKQADSSFKLPTKGINIDLEYSLEKPNTKFAFINARILTMEKDSIIENGTILVENNIIKAVDRTSQVNIDESFTKINCDGMTIMPGFIDAHAHGNHFRYGITPQKHWPYYANLAYGVTTMHDPSAYGEMVFSNAELIKSGKIVGPRVFSTGTILYGADGDFKAVVNSLEDARSAIRRSKALGAFSVKSYNQPRREQRQMIIQAAREEKMMVVPEGGSFFYHNMSMINDGHTGIEHNIPVVDLYQDVINTWKASKTGYTPTLIVCYGAVSGEYYWYQKTNVWEDKKLLTFTPRSVIDSRSRHRTMIPDEEYENGFIRVSKSCKMLADEGVKLNLGAHGQIQGIGAHWELWMLQMGGLTNYQALKTATSNPAQYLGLDKWIGSLKSGKLADLIILEKNPLEDIKNTASIKYTMINGHLYDAKEMKELNNSRSKVRTPFYWESTKFAQDFDWHEDGNTRTQCQCGNH
jgi:Tol biopolymer transport system component/imidazolonepropionase-like amidohydrolase